MSLFGGEGNLPVQCDPYFFIRCSVTLSALPFR
jgi:hypothetical protein